MTTITTIFNNKEISAEVKKNQITINDKIYTINRDDIMTIQSGEEIINVDDIIQLGNGLIRVELLNYTLDIKVENPFDIALGSDVQSGIIESPMAGVISSIHVDIGMKIEKGDTIMVISAMKMENKIISPVSGIVKNISVSMNEQINSNQLLAEVEKVDNNE